MRSLTRPCFLLLVLGRLFFACPSSPPWNLLSFTVECTLSLPCSHSDLPLSRQGAALAHLDSLPPHDLVLRTDGLFLFLLAKAAPLPTALSAAPRPLFPFQQTQYAQVFPLKPAPLCTLFAGLGNPNRPASSSIRLWFCPILIFPFYSISGRNGLLSPPVLSDYNGSPDTRFLQFLVVSLFGLETYCLI